MANDKENQNLTRSFTAAVAEKTGALLRRLEEFKQSSMEAAQKNDSNGFKEAATSQKADVHLVNICIAAIENQQWQIGELEKRLAKLEGGGIVRLDKQPMQRKPGES